MGWRAARILMVVARLKPSISPEQAQTDRPHGAFVDASGRILIADSFNDRILGIVR